jgi:hypothetical protein
VGERASIRAPSFRSIAEGLVPLPNRPPTMREMRSAVNRIAKESVSRQYQRAAAPAP